VEKDGIPYVGFEFGCTWDEEHGLGVLMHGTRTVEIGDTAMDCERRRGIRCGNSGNRG